VLKTTSQLLSFHKTIENKQAELYSVLAEKHIELSQVFSNLAKESIKHINMAQRAYREGITDAFEVGFLEATLDPKDYILTEPYGDLNKSVKVMIDNEETIIRFCLDAASSSGKLLPDLPQTFERLVKRKKHNDKKSISCFKFYLFNSAGSIYSEDFRIL